MICKFCGKEIDEAKETAHKLNKVHSLKEDNGTQRIFTDDDYCCDECYTNTIVPAITKNINEAIKNFFD